MCFWAELYSFLVALAASKLSSKQKCYGGRRRRLCLRHHPQRRRRGRKISTSSSPRKALAVYKLIEMKLFCSATRSSGLLQHGCIPHFLCFNND
ncbi:hypothetical protein ES319_D09G262400v1 [Gossypium barbadense]|uniref:Secreted protein n=2 Tax=Gossypium TaxID=3633 RepID=A0A5J5Q7A7_GOSBA|nr:hypothetical protein ES319_D09G262400v1 [Gossypium barbadense]TYG55523.1 hypothetical protein ES288_D09G280300v1 [Gossypium darwinii]